MKIGFLFGSFLRGGSQLQAIGVAQAMRSEHDIAFAVVKTDKTDRGLFGLLPGILQKDPRSLTDWADVVHFDGTASLSEVSQLLAPVARKVLWFHGSARGAPVRNYLAGLRFPRGITHVATSRYVAKSLPRFSSVIYYLDTELFSPRPTVKKSYDLVIVGRLRPVKNHELFLRIAAEGSFSWLAVGGTSLGAGVKMNAIETMLRSAARPGIDHVAGGVDQFEVPGLIAQARVGVITSNSEGGGGLELLACGIPVVARNVGGVAEMYEPGQRHLLVPRNAPPGVYVEKIRDALQFAHNNSGYRASIVERFGREKAMSDYSALYQTIQGRALT